MPGAAWRCTQAENLAVDAIMGYAKDLALLGGESIREEAMRTRLTVTGMLELESFECYYGVEEHDCKECLDDDAGRKALGERDRGCDRTTR